MSDLSKAIRIKLEGRLEVIEAAGPRYLALERLIAGNWRRRAIEARDEVLKALAEEADLDDALAEAQRLPDRAPIAGLLARLDAYRRELAQRMDAGTWSDARALLKATAESVRLPRPEEVVALYGTAERRLPMWLLVSAPSLFAMVALGPIAAAGVFVSAFCLALAVIPLGRYALLADRLVWVPHSGVPLELPIAELKTVELAGRGVRLTAGSQRLSLPAVDAGPAMVALLRLYRDGPLKGVDRPPAGTSLVLPAFLASGTPTDGVALLHPGGLFFLAKGQAPAVLSRLITRALNVSERFVLEQLSRLDQVDLVPLLASLKDVDRCLHATTAQVLADPIRGGKLRLRVGVALVDLSLSGVDSVALATLLPWTKAP